MSSFEVNIPDDFLSGVLKSDFDDIAKEALEECAPMLESEMKGAIQRVVGHEGDSELVKSVKARKPKRTKTDAMLVFVGPSGNSKNYYYQGNKKKRTYTVTNALKAIWLEYGRAGQSAKPWLANATKNCQQTIMEKMQEIYERKTGTGK